MTNITIATRGSLLALWQAKYIASRLTEQHGANVSLLVLKTKGDIILDVPLAKVGGKGLFVKEIEEALLDGRADIAVHSMKDVPMELPSGLVLGVVPLREDPADLLLSTRYPDLESLPAGAVIGTSSLRRQAQLLHKRPDLAVRSLRGNVNTRLRKLMDGEYDGIILAAAGVERLGLEAPHMARLCPPDFLPAAGQGALGIEFHENRHDLRGILEFLNHSPTYDTVSAERSFLAGLEGGCQVPIAAHATLPDGNQGTTLQLEGMVANATGTEIVRRSISGLRTQAKELGHTLALEIKNAGGAALLSAIYEVGTV